MDSHRSPFFAISAYNRPGDYFRGSLTDIFAATPDLAPYSAIVPQADRDELNPPNTAAAKMSENVDFSAPDRIDDTVFNEILWTMMKGSLPIPGRSTRAPLHTYQIGR